MGRPKGSRQSEETRAKIAAATKQKHKDRGVYERCSKCEKFHNGSCR